VDSAEAAQMLTDYLRANGYPPVPQDAAQQLQLTMLREWIAHLCAVLNQETDLNRAAKMRVIRAMIYGSVPRDAELQMRKHLTQTHIGQAARADFDAGTSHAPQEGRV
jgi:hypothetical protein